MVGRSIKRSMDVIVGGVLLLMTSPVIGALAVLILVRDGRPIFFRQRRSGRNGTPFELLKFRTMSTESDDPTTDATRITKLGAKLRSTSLDELPSFVNVVRGDMSLVGPRPLPERYFDRYSDRQRRRLEVRPGVTGLAQVRGRNDLSWDERFELDVDYVDGQTLLLDLKLLLETARSVATREGTEVEGTVTMPEFWGSGQPDSTITS